MSRLLSFGLLSFVFLFAIANADLYTDNQRVQRSVCHPNSKVADNVNRHILYEIILRTLSFAQNLLNEINESHPKTTIFSPVSIVSALALMMFGATGRSYSELENVFGQHDIVVLQEQMGLLLCDLQFIHNFLFIQKDYSISPTFKLVASQIYNVKVTPVDFENDPSQAKQFINSYGSLDNILPKNLPNSTTLLMASTLTFMDEWNFAIDDTIHQNFYPNGEGTQPAISIEMMRGYGTFYYLENPHMNIRIVGLPYKDFNNVMYVIQPMRSSVKELLHMQQRLNWYSLEDMMYRIKRVSGDLVFPKLYLTDSFKLAPLLKRLGIKSIFTGIQSDLHIIGNKAHKANDPNSSNLILHDILHRVDLRVTERGTMPTYFYQSDQTKTPKRVEHTFNINTPFLFVVFNHDTLLPLYYGVVNEPPSKE